MAAISNRWSPRFFPATELSKHAEYRLKAESLIGADWEAVRRAARAGRLHYYSVHNFPDMFWGSRGYLNDTP
jgi:hypothetical protein